MLVSVIPQTNTSSILFVFGLGLYLVLIGLFSNKLRL